MKLAVLALLALATLAYGRSVDFEDEIEEFTAYNYHKRFGIKLANKIRAAEEAEVSGSRIVGGTETAPDQIPYQAGLIISLPNAEGVCSGALVNERTAVTAAHCWWDGQTAALRLTIVLGSMRLFSGGLRMTTRNIWLHGDWNPATLRNDIAIIHLPSMVETSSTIGIIALPSVPELSQNFAGHTAIVSGYGLTGDGDAITVQQGLRHVGLTVITNAECQAAPGMDYNIRPANLCTRGEAGRGTCSGDSGGPLVTIANNRPVLIGLASFTYANCEAGLPGVFTRITSFWDFIHRYW